MTIDFVSLRAQAEQHHCEFCQAAPGETCRNHHTGEPLEHLPAHFARVIASRRPATPPDAEDGAQ
jgi:hypothetical protein